MGSLESRIESLADGQSVAANGMTVTMHRKNAGTKRADGWIAATSTGCVFSIAVPEVFNDFSQSTATTDGSMLRVHVLGTRTGETKFTALCFTRDDNTIPPDWAASAIDQLGRGGLEVTSRSEIADQRAKGVEIRASSAFGSRLIGRFIGTGTHAYQLLIEFPAAEEQQAARRASVFFDSFKPAAEPGQRN